MTLQKPSRVTFPRQHQNWKPRTVIDGVDAVTLNPSSKDADTTMFSSAGRRSNISLFPTWFGSESVGKQCGIRLHT